MRAQIRTTTPASENRARRGPRAIDLLFHCTARRQAERGLNCFRTPALALADMDSAAIDAAFVSQCKKWSCERQWMCVDTRGSTSGRRQPSTRVVRSIPTTT